MAMSDEFDEIPPLEPIEEPSFQTPGKSVAEASLAFGVGITSNSWLPRIEGVHIYPPEESDSESTSDSEESDLCVDYTEGNAAQVQESSLLNEKHSSSRVPRRSSDQINPSRLLRAPELAAQAVASDKGGWLVFDPNMKQLTSLELAAEKFLAWYPPSTVTKVGGCPIDWISAKAPKTPDKNMDKESGNKINIEKLEDAWHDLNASGQQITYEKVKELARAHNALCGKWMLWKKPGPHIDLTWERILRATITGNLGICTKVSSAFNESSTSSWDRTHLVCIYNKDFTDEADVMDLEARLRGIGIRCRLVYKPDAFTYLGIYRRNEWGLSPIIYTSQFDVRKGCSTVTSVYK